MKLRTLALSGMLLLPALVLADTDPGAPPIAPNPSMAGTVHTPAATPPSQIKELAGLVMIDAALQVNRGLTEGTFIELVEVSTPTAPAANHARLFLTPGTGSKQQLSIIFDDGTAVRITGN